MNADPGQPAGTPGTRAAGHVVDRYRRAVEPAVRGVAGVLVPVAFFAAGAALAPGTGLAWYRVNTAVAVFVVVLAAGFCLEWLVAARTGRRTLGRGPLPAEPDGEHAQDR